LRSDYLSCNGSTKVKTPNLDSLAQQGVNFTRVRAAVPLTLPSHISIMTSHYPVKHGVRDNGTAHLSNEYSTLAEVLKSHGYQTAAFVGSFVLDHRFGLNQGFDVYNDRMPADLTVLEKLEAERNADAVYSAFSEWFVRNAKKQPYFLWIHFYDPHAPYDPPELYRSKYPNDPYAGEVAYTDAVIGKILNNLKTQDSNNQIIAVVGDHGEGLGQHQEATHSLLIYNSTLQVPMIIDAPGLISAGTTFPYLCRTIDLAPTLLDLAGIQNDLKGQGISLKKSIEQMKDPGIISASESLYPKINLGWSELRGIENDQFHFIDAPKPELYDVIDDPDETKNLMNKQATIAGNLQNTLNQLYQGSSSSAQNSQPEMDAETKERLASLGYVSGSNTAPNQSSRIDPKDKMKVWNDIQAGIFEFGRGNYQGAVKILELVLKTDNSIPIVYDNLCSSYLRLENWEKAKSCNMGALQRGIDFPALHVNLGLIYHKDKQYSQAQKEFLDALSADPSNTSAHYYLANTLRATGQHEQALIQYQKALQLSPDNVFVVNGLAMTYIALKRDAEALTAFEKAAGIDPQNPAAHYNLAVQAERMNKTEEAVNAYEKFLVLSDEKNFAQQRLRAKQALQKLRGT
ncbi:sulfatase-like hydrolase/transferase, partial [bacterium]|nr:sulfatase-like hydrolase/transferase [bacterium]